MTESLHYWIVNVRIPDCFIDNATRSPNLEISLHPTLHSTLQRDRLFPCHLEIDNGQITAIVPNFTDALPSQIPTEDLPIIDGKHGIIIPCLVDLHTHLDKGHMWERNPNLDGTFEGALQGIYRDCVEQNNWNHDDLYRRMEFGLEM